jgi:predicted GTPase
MMEAAKKAETFAEIVAKNRALPDKPKNIVGKCLDIVKEVSVVKKEYPEMWDIVSGIVGGVVGVIAGSKAVESSEDDKPIEVLDFDNME